MVYEQIREIATRYRMYCKGNKVHNRTFDEWASGPGKGLIAKIEYGRFSDPKLHAEFDSLIEKIDESINKLTSTHNAEQISNKIQPGADVEYLIKFGIPDEYGDVFLPGCFDNNKSVNKPSSAAPFKMDKRIDWCDCSDECSIIDRGSEHLECFACGKPYPRANYKDEKKPAPATKTNHNESPVSQDKETCQDDKKPTQNLLYSPMRVLTSRQDGGMSKHKQLVMEMAEEMAMATHKQFIDGLFEDIKWDEISDEQRNYSISQHMVLARIAVKYMGDQVQMALYKFFIESGDIHKYLRERGLIPQKGGTDE